MEQQKCVVCQRRNGYYLGGRACSQCRTLTAAEGTREKYGLPKPRLRKAISDAAFVAKYNKLIDDGYTVAQAAEALGLEKQSLKNKKGELSRGGYDIRKAPYSFPARVVPQEPVDRSTLHSRANDHGEGCGITGCKCELCIEARRAYRNNWTANNREKTRAYRQKMAEKKKARREKPS